MCRLGRLALNFIVKGNGQAQQEMVRFRDYRELTYLLKRIKAWLNNHILVGFEQHDNKAGNEACLLEPQHFAAVAARRALFVSKKLVVEEAFEISLGDNTQHRATSLELVSIKCPQVVASKRRSRALRHQ
ncbi:uncharacterized protein LOC124342893 isoform X2 [Daphnia pulicaria]|uniref:uncharacterized protein LOC124342893 isoform X2 n=1 Tax=Daphnia pulicaria TaxID=35523 RepID=UPI001EEB97B4|nr:uncharacterized protein LOC124342893 isoform X2 [Daphnia pulicaria]